MGRSCLWLMVFDFFSGSPHSLQDGHNLSCFHYPSPVIQGLLHFLSKLANLPHDILCTWNQISFPLSHGYQTLYSKVRLSAADFSVPQCPVQINCNIPGPDWNPTLSGWHYHVVQCASMCQAGQKGGKPAAILAASISSLTELETKENFVIKWYVSLVICNVIKVRYIV